MPIKVTHVSDDFKVASPRIKALIVGEPGAGKTRSASTWPNVLYANAEGGTMSVRDRDVRATEITSTGDLDELRSILNQSAEVRATMLSGPVDTVVIDTLDEVARIIIRERLHAEKHETMQMADWGFLGDTLRALVRGYRNLDLNVLFHVHVKGQEDSDSGRLVYKPMIQGAMGDEIAGYVDEALLLVARPVTDPQTGERVIARYFQTFPDSQHEWLKDRSGKLPMEFTINFDDDYRRMADLIFEPAKAQAEARQNLVAIKEELTPTGLTVTSSPVTTSAGANITVTSPEMTVSGTASAPVPVSEAPSGLNKDGTPKKRRGRPPKDRSVPAVAPTSEPVSEAPPVQAPVDLPITEAQVAKVAADPLAELDGREPVSETETMDPVPDPLGEVDEVIRCTQETGDGETCDKPVEGQDYVDLSLMRYGQVLCREHFAARKTAR